MTARSRLRHGAGWAAVALAVSTVFIAPPAHASTSPTNAVVTWNLYAQNAIWDVAAQSPWVQGRGFAMVHGAIYDAVNAIAGTPHQPYLVAPPADGSESADAAVAAAAHRVLAALFPAQGERLRAQYEEFLATIPDGPSKLAGIAVGIRAADAMIADRQGDGAFGNEPWLVGTQPGQWRPTPPTFGNAGQWAGTIKPFFIPSPSAFRTSGPPALTSRAYARDLNEVKRIGSATSPLRTADQTDAAIWWHDRRLTQWEINRNLAVSQGLDLLASARMFAMVKLATADANTACFNEKGAWNFWRPVTAVQLADTDGNPATVADPTWTPLLITPPSPDYTSGHGCYTGAAMVTLAYFFGRDNVPFSASSQVSGTTRHYGRFSEALVELINARVWGGIHFRTADVQGAWIGAQVSAYMILHEFRRIR